MKQGPPPLPVLHALLGEGEDAKEGHHVALSWKGGGHGGWMTGKHGGGMLCWLTIRQKLLEEGLLEEAPAQSHLHSAERALRWKEAALTHRSRFWRERKGVQGLTCSVFRGRRPRREATGRSLAAVL